MNAKQTLLAVDLGAESGRVMAVHFDGRHLDLEELHRFPNTPVKVHQTVHWDFLRLWHDIQHGISLGQAQRPVSIGVDTWGVDFGLLDQHGQLLGNPVHYRDSRTEGMMPLAFERVGRETIFKQTGIQFMPINTIYQLLSLVENDDPQLAQAATFLSAPDLLNYWLTGAKVCEMTNATTTQLYNPLSGGWATDLMAQLGIPTHIFPEIVPPGTRLGTFEGIPVIAPACHDTGSAVAAVPTNTSRFAYISSGTWSLVGLEIDRPILSEAALAANVTNEGGINGTTRLLKNVMGLWILQQCRATWAAAGQSYSYGELVELAAAAPPLAAVFNANDPRFLPPGDHPALVQMICRETGQPVPDTPGEIARAVLESLALAYRQVLEEVMAVSGQAVDVIHVVGGGAQNELLNQMTADATGRPVIAGPVEATVLGNALVQLIALGEVANMAEGRQIVATLPGAHRYNPRPSADWDNAFRHI